MKSQKGFTIIELIVVIAIIAVLATIVLVNVTQYINKGKDAAIKSNLGTILTNSAVWADSNADYVGFSATQTAAQTAISNAGGSVAFYEDSAFAACSALLAGGNFCVDSTGFKGSGTCTSSVCTPE